MENNGFIFDGEDLENKLVRYDKLAAKKGLEAAKCEALFKNLEEQKKNLLCASMGCVEGSEATRERIGRSSEEFKSFIRGLNEARTEYLIASAEAVNAQRHFETTSRLITKRSEELRRLRG